MGKLILFSLSFLANTFIVYEILSGCPASAVAGSFCALSILSSRKDAEMLQVTDSGCAEHHARPITLTGLAAALVGRLVLNLPPTNTGYSYICEHGHTHYLTLQPRQGNVTSNSPRFEVAGNSPLNH
jgi:hypothetical protein